MKKIFKCISILLVSISAFSQSGKVTYNVTMPLDVSAIPKDKVDFISKMIGYANDQKFELIFCNNQTTFKIIGSLEDNSNYDPKMANIARIAFTSGDDVYVDYKNKVVVNKKGDGVLIESVLEKPTWQVTTDSKLIEKYLCYKAILDIIYQDRNGEERHKEIVAWFSPALAYGFGPKNFYGLPGLILELTENKTTYLATTIKLSDKEIKIDFPKGKTISKEEYNKKLESSLGGVLIGKKRENEKDIK